LFITSEQRDLSIRGQITFLCTHQIRRLIKTKYSEEVKRIRVTSDVKNTSHNIQSQNMWSHLSITNQTCIQETLIKLQHNSRKEIVKNRMPNSVKGRISITKKSSPGYEIRKIRFARSKFMEESFDKIRKS